MIATALRRLEARALAANDRRAELRTELDRARQARRLDIPASTRNPGFSTRKGHE